MARIYRMGLGNQLIIILRVDKELRVICGIRVLIKSTVCTVFHVFATSSIIARSENKKKAIEIFGDPV